MVHNIEASMVGVYPHVMVAEALPLFSVFCALPSGIAHHLFDGTYNVGPSPVEVLEVQLFDELGQRQLPGLLPSVGQAAELLRVQPQLSGHLDMGTGKLAAPSRLDRWSVLLCYLLLRHRSSIQRKGAHVAEDSGPLRIHYHSLAAPWQTHSRFSMTHTKIKYFLDERSVFH